MVYLTADAAEELQELDLGKVYIIGGLVDRNRYKNVCLEKAAHQVTQPSEEFGLFISSRT